MRPLQNTQHSKIAAVYFVSSSERLSEALLLQQEVASQSRDDIAVVALLEDLTEIPRFKFQRAQNRNVIMPIFRGDEDASMNFIGSRIGVYPSVAA
jgi:surfactin synthase thioesterase subunit